MTQAAAATRSETTIPHAESRVARMLLIATLLVPIVVWPGFFFPFVTLRSVYFRVLVETAVAVLLYLVLRREAGFDVKRDAVFWALLAWVGANLLAAAFGVAPVRSVFGDYERMGGVWFWVHLLAYYVALRTFMRESDWWRFFRVAIATAVALSIYGLVQYWFRPFAFGIGGIDAGVTIGNQGLLGAYLLANISMAAFLVAHARGRVRLPYLAAAFVLITGLVFSGNRSSTLGVVLGSGIALVAYIFWSRRATPHWIALAAGVFAIALALPFVANTPFAGAIASHLPAVQRLSTGVDSIRVVQWRAAVDGIRQRPLMGFGPENYQIVWSRFYHPEMYRFLTDSRFDRAHNAYLDAFATTGVFGFLALLATFLAIAWVTTDAARRNRDGTGSAVAIEATALGFLGAYAFYVFFWFFDLNSAMLWIAVAAFASTRRSGVPLIAFGPLRKRRGQTTLVLAVGGIAFAALLYVHGFETLRMARILDRVGEAARAPEEVLEDYESVFGSPAPVTQHVFSMYAGHLASLRPRFAEIRNDMSSAALFDRAFVLAIREFERQAERDPFNERITVQHARVLILGAYYYGNPRLYESALRRLHRAVELAPRRVPVYLVLGTAYLNVRRSREALATYEKAYAIYPALGQTHAYLGMAHATLGEYREATRWLTSALRAGYAPDRSTILRVSRALSEAGDPRRAAELIRDHLYLRNGPVYLWGQRPEPVDPGDYELANIASERFARGGDPAFATMLESAAPLLCDRSVALEQLAAGALMRHRAGPGDCRQPWREARAY